MYVYVYIIYINNVFFGFLEMLSHFNVYILLLLLGKGVDSNYSGFSSNGKPLHVSCSKLMSDGPGPFHHRPFAPQVAVLQKKKSKNTGD